jgi:hypothetical protein
VSLCVQAAFSENALVLPTLHSTTHVTMEKKNQGCASLHPRAE